MHHSSPLGDTTEHGGVAMVKPKPLPPRHAAYKGEVARIVLGMLREAKRPCSTQEFTMHVMAERGMNTADKRLVKTVTKRIGARLRGLGQRIAWEVASKALFTADGAR